MQRTFTLLSCVCGGGNKAVITENSEQRSQIQDRRELSPRVSRSGLGRNQPVPEWADGFCATPYGTCADCTPCSRALWTLRAWSSKKRCGWIFSRIGPFGAPARKRASSMSRPQTRSVCRKNTTAAFISVDIASWRHRDCKRVKCTVSSCSWIELLLVWCV